MLVNMSEASASEVTEEIVTDRSGVCILKSSLCGIRLKRKLFWPAAQHFGRLALKLLLDAKDGPNKPWVVSKKESGTDH
jgi:hypothetical protein